MTRLNPEIELSAAREHIEEQSAKIKALGVHNTYLENQLRLREEFSMEIDTLVTEGRAELFSENAELRSENNSKDAKILEMEKAYESALDEVQKLKSGSRQLRKELKVIREDAVAAA